MIIKFERVCWIFLVWYYYNLVCVCVIYYSNDSFSVFLVEVVYF